VESGLAHRFAFSTFSRKEDAHEAGGWRTRKRSTPPQCPTAWAIGAIIIIAVVATIIFYSGRDIHDLTTTASPNSSPSVTTGAK